jgi:hypothetical protein
MTKAADGEALGSPLGIPALESLHFETLCKQVKFCCVRKKGRSSLGAGLKAGTAAFHIWHWALVIDHSELNQCRLQVPSMPNEKCQMPNAQ